MDLLREKVGRLYTRYLAAAFGSALISSIYGMVDMAMVGQYQGPEGTAALAVVAPIWNLIYSLGLLTGIGGSVLFSTARGSGAGERKARRSILPPLFWALWSWPPCAGAWWDSLTRPSSGSSGRRTHCCLWRGSICCR